MNGENSPFDCRELPKLHQLRPEGGSLECNSEQGLSSACLKFRPVYHGYSEILPLAFAAQVPGAEVRKPREGNSAGTEHSYPPSARHLVSLGLSNMLQLCPGTTKHAPGFLPPSRATPRQPEMVQADLRVLHSPPSCAEWQNSLALSASEWQTGHTHRLHQAVPWIWLETFLVSEYHSPFRESLSRKHTLLWQTTVH